MPRNGSGTYTLPEAAFVGGTVISSDAVNNDLSDIALALTGSVAADGQTPITGSFNLADGTASSPSYSFITNSDDGIYHPGAGEVGIALAGEEAFVFSAPSADAGMGLVLLNSINPVPIGIVQDFAGSSAPTGWLLCYGQAISRDDFDLLFDVIGTTYGSGNGTTTFNLPDCRGRTVAGKDDMGGASADRLTVAGCGFSGDVLGNTGGDEVHVLTENELAVHDHDASQAAHNHTATLSQPALLQQSGASLQLGGGGGSAATVTVSVGNATPAVTVDDAGNDDGHNNVQPTIIFNKIIFAGQVG